MKYYRKKIWVSDRRYVWVRLYKTRKDMLEYADSRNSDKEPFDRNLAGCHFAYRQYVVGEGTPKFIAESGTVLLNMEYLGAGIVAHELLHAVLWAFKHSTRKKDNHPLAIKDMKQEERICYALTDACIDFWNWWVDRKFKKK